MIENVLVTRFSALGDIAMLLPILKAVANNHPDINFTLLTSSKFVSFGKLLPPNVRIKGINLLGNENGLTTIKKSLVELDFKHYDILLDAHAVWRTLYIQWLFRIAGKKINVIKKGYIRRFLHIYFKSNIQIPSIQQRYIDLFKQVKMNLTLSSLLPLVQNNIKKNIGISPFAKHNNKIYPLPKMETVIKTLSQILKTKNEEIYLFGGGKHELNILNNWERKYDNVKVVSGKTDLVDELALMSSLRVMLSMDSANMHFASLAGTRVVSIWGATHPNCGFLDFNQSLSDCIQRDMPCRPCSVYGNKKCKFNDTRCLNIDPFHVVNKIMTIYE